MSKLNYLNSPFSNRCLVFNQPIDIEINSENKGLFLRIPLLDIELWRYNSAEAWENLFDVVLKTVDNAVYENTERRELIERLVRIEYVNNYNTFIIQQVY